MTDRSIFRLDFFPMEEHPALIAWNKLQLQGSPPKAIGLLKPERRRHASKKSSLYRLQGVGPNGSNVIAKNSNHPSLLIEKIVYQEILPKLPLTNLRFYGFVEDKESNSFWIFLEDAEGEYYHEVSFVHRALASKWLGILHGITSKMNYLAEKFPSIGIQNYKSLLYLSRKNILDNLNNASLQSCDVILLKNILGYCDVIDSSWDKIEKICAGIPSCIVHRDFYEKNVRVRTGKEEASLLVFDWGRTAWGLPSEDVAGLDPFIYWKNRNQHQPDVFKDVGAVERFIKVSVLLRYLAWIQATSSALACEWVDEIMRNFKIYETGLAEACQFLEHKMM